MTASLPPKIDLIEVHALQARLDAYFGKWTEWEQNRTSWLIVANRADAFNDLAYLWEKALRLAVAKPEHAAEILAWVDSTVHETGEVSGTTDGKRKDEWWGNYSEEQAEACRDKCRDAVYALEKKYMELGVSWLTKDQK